LYFIDSNQSQNQQIPNNSANQRISAHRDSDLVAESAAFSRDRLRLRLAAPGARVTDATDVSVSELEVDFTIRRTLNG
jgi:hypothetical protein